MTVDVILDHAITVRDLLLVAAISISLVSGVFVPACIMAAVYYFWPHQPSNQAALNPLDHEQTK